MTVPIIYFLAAQVRRFLSVLDGDLACFYSANRIAPICTNLDTFGFNVYC
ncbi:hypothetical protein EPHNCH_0132 [Anaplasma phagocytophilum str. NCH-1]|uniref:Uncharacterized protein n=1 Tax=Anaplasma phagocytophilum str. NCH-1 TaxID=1359161 RepID=A0A0F3MUK0_ANAPH|nr:hypothetical protein EPHNCH_1585 [Anaplasma phagocytophilum str. NCH-1]KJV68637.1 hypothetical protein EPHNCH_0132 [Anaplasma phagocytophilum str. NCH-1]